MASTEERVKSLISENLEVDGKPVEVSDLSSSLTEPWSVLYGRRLLCAGYPERVRRIVHP